MRVLKYLLLLTLMKLYDNAESKLIIIIFIIWRSSNRSKDVEARGLESALRLLSKTSQESSGSAASRM